MAETKGDGELYTKGQELKQFSTGSRKVDAVLQTLFAKVLNLEQWLRHIDKNGILITTLVGVQDKASYVHLLKTTVVAFKQNVKKIPEPICFTQVSHQQEIIIRVVRKLIQKEGPGKNVLTFGFSRMSENPKASIFDTPDVESHHSNSSVNRLLFEAWETFLGRLQYLQLPTQSWDGVPVPQPITDLIRVGDDVMSYLLEYVSIFGLVDDPAIYVQLTGEPLYQMWPYSLGSSCPVKIPYLLKSAKRKRYMASSALPSKIKRSALPSAAASRIQGTAFLDESTRPRAEKRKFSSIEPSTAKKTGNNKKSTETHLRNSERFQPLTAPSSCCRQGSTDNENNEVSGFAVSLPGSFQGEFVSASSDIVGSHSKQSKREGWKNKGKSCQQKECSPDLQSYLYHKFILKLNLIYGAEMRERFPKSFALHNTEPEDGPRLLLQDIFVKTDVGGNIGSVCDCQCREVLSGKEQCGQKVSGQKTVSSQEEDSARMQKSDSTTDDSSFLSSSDIVPPSPCPSKVSYFHVSGSSNHLSKHNVPDKESAENVSGNGEMPCQQNDCDGELSTQTPLSSDHENLVQDVSQEDSFVYHISDASSTSKSGAQDCPTVIDDNFSKGKPHSILNMMQHKTSQEDTIHSCEQAAMSGSNKRGNCKCMDQSGLEVAADPLSAIQDLSMAQHDQHLVPGFEQNVKPFLKQFLQNHRKCPYWSLLNHYCPVKFEVVKQKQPSGHIQLKRRHCHSHHSHTRANTGHLLEDFCQHNKVFGFLRAVLKRVVPAQLFGGCRNMAVFLKNVKKLVGLGKYEKLCLGEVMRGIKVRLCGWLLSVNCHRRKIYHVAQLLWWLMTYFVAHLIRTFFYCTDTTVYRNRIFYYRKKIWLRLQAKAMQDFRKSTNLQRITQNKKIALLASNQALGVSILRFLPKTRSLRPIVNMSKKPVSNSSQPQSNVKSTNQQLAKLLQALACEKSHDRSICGHSVSGMEDIYVALKHFVAKRKADGDLRPLYFVKTDIKKCFDSIQQPLLHSIVHSILSKDGPQIYFMHKYCTIIVSGGQIKRRFYTDTTRLADYDCDCYISARRKATTNNLSDVIFIDQMITQFENFESLMKLLSSHLYNNIIKMGKQYYIQQGGISQGSVVSTMLANLYLAHLEAAHLFPVAGDELSFRMVDDCLFVTPDKAKAESFLSLMVEGFPDYNCFVNLDKILTNFPFVHPSVGSVQCIHQGEPFPWCGLLFDSSVQVAVDYTRYSGLGIGDVISFDGCYKPGETIKKKMIMSLALRSYQIFFDPLINSEERILLNACCEFFFLAQIFNALVMKLPPKKRTDSNPHFFFGIVEMLPKFLLAQIQRKLMKEETTNLFPVQLRVLQWLNVCTFLMQLKRYSGYTLLEKKLNRHKKTLQGKLTRDQVEMLEEVCCAGASLMSTVTMF